MNYELIYQSLIDKARSRIIPDGVYCERHHIIPKSLNGSNDKNNIVRLYPREHYIAHLLLFKKYERMYQNNKGYRNEYIKMLWAMGAIYYFPASKTEEGLRQRVFKGNSRIYADIKHKLSALIGVRNRERINSLSCEEKCELSKKISDGLKRAYNERGCWWIGKQHSEETKKLLSSIKKNTGVGEDNSQYGSFWGMNVETFESRKFKKGEELPNGWIRGRCQNSKRRLERVKDKKSKKKLIKKVNQEKIELYTKMYKDYCKMPFSEVVKKYNYQYSLPNFVQMCKTYVKEFIPQNGKRRIASSKQNNEKK